MTLALPGLTAVAILAARLWLTLITTLANPAGPAFTLVRSDAFPVGLVAIPANSCRRGKKEMSNAGNPIVTLYEPHTHTQSPHPIITRLIVVVLIRSLALTLYLCARN